MTTDLPYSEEAKKRGYTLHSHSGDGNRSCYTKDGVCFEIWESSGKAKLSITDGLILAHIEFSLPNKNLDMFERKIRAWRDAVQAL